MMAQLVQWAFSHGAGLNENVEVCADNSGYSLRTRIGGEGIVVKGRDSISLTEDKRIIISCPLTLSLSAFNAFHECPLSHLENEVDPAHFPYTFLENTPFHVIGKFFLCQQYLMRKESFWFPYISALPQPDNSDSISGGKGLDTPLFWTEEDVDWIRGTNMEWARQERLVLWTAEWEDAVGLLRDREFENWENFSWELYKWASTIFSSRCFVSSSLPLHVLYEVGSDKHWIERVEKEHK